MSEVEPGSGDSDPSAAEPPGRALDFSAVQGFQLIGAEDRGGADDPAWRDALILELETRAARFHQAVDSAIVLSNDGVIRWLGDPVARLTAGADALNPSALILADPSLPEASQDTITKRVELWIAATTRRILAPLFALEALQEGPESVRDLARKLARSLGILEREPIRTEINALSQSDRAELRKQGVRFGAYYLFVPALLKPAPRTLALQLWSLRASGDAGELLRALAPVAASGRTSLALDAGISHEGYRVAGYRPCGERAVRVDIIERLGGMIRAAIGGERPGVQPEGTSHPESRPASKGFVVNGQMTSLTGCSGEQFASILRSMRFRPVEVRRSEFFAAPAGEPSEQPAPLAPKEAQTSAGDDSLTAQETGEETAAIEPVAASAETPLADGEPLLDGAPSPASADPAALAGPEANGAEEGASSQASAPGHAQLSDAETIVVWRPDRHRTRPNRRETNSNPPSRNATPRRDGADDRSPVRPAEGERHKKRRPNPGTGIGRAPASADQPGRDANEKHRQQASDRDMRSNPAAGARPRANVDPNSPFAKLLELRPLLEEQASKRPWRR